jgi:septum site-determining protein MinD
LSSKTHRAISGLSPIKEHLLITRYLPKRVSSGDMLSAEDVQEILAIPLLGIIPESTSVLQASNAGVPVVLDGRSNAGQAYLDAVARFLGEEKRHRFGKKRGFLTRLLGN